MEKNYIYYSLHSKNNFNIFASVNALKHWLQILNQGIFLDLTCNPFATACQSILYNLFLKNRDTFLHFLAAKNAPMS